MRLGARAALCVDCGVRTLRFAALALGLLAPASALADAPAVPLARLLRAAGRPHAFADASGRIPVTVSLPAGADARALGLLPVAPGIGAIRLSSNEVEAFSATHPELGLHVAPPRWPLLDVSKVWTGAESYRAQTGDDGAGVVVGVIDTGIDIAHPDFRDAAGKSRIAWMLVAAQPLGIFPELEAAYGCTDPAQTPCAILSNVEIDALLSVPDASRPRDPEGHGTHVASIAAGNGGPSVTNEPRYVGVAPGATLVIAAPATPGTGFRDPDILNAARFIFERADALGLPAVVNLSVGGDFGSHDGTSDLEKGLAAFVGDDKPGRAIVVAAGNSGALYELPGGTGPYGIHTEAHVPSYGDVRVPIYSPPSKSGRGFVWITFAPGDEVSVGLLGPDDATWIDLVAPGDEAGYDEDGVNAAVVNRLPNGKTPITPDTNSAVVVFDGAWPEGYFTIRMQGHGDASLWLVGQGDVDSGSGSGLLFERAMKQGTINVPASHPNLLSVGCTVNRLSWDPVAGPKIGLVSLGGDDDPHADDICYFSAAGPTPFGVPKPELVAPGAFVAGAMSEAADPRLVATSIFAPGGCPGDSPCYVVDDRHAITSGTSMSSPHVAGAIALLLQRDPNLTQAQLTELLQASAQYPTGSIPHQTQVGPGALDLVGALALLTSMDTTPVEPDLHESWYSLSSSYARPDGAWPVTGIVELRKSDRTPVSGLDGTRLELEVEGGVVLEPLTKIRPGMWRFSIAGQPGSGGKTLRVDVTYDGVSLCASPRAEACSARTLPIGVDVWAAGAGFSAGGSGFTCALGIPSSPESAGWPAVTLLGLLAARHRRARARASRPR